MIPLRLLLAGGAAVAVLGLAGGLYWKIQHDAEAKWKARVEAAQAQAAVNANTTQALDQYATKTIVIREKAEASVQRVQEAVGADTPIPPDVLNAWREGLK